MSTAIRMTWKGEGVIKSRIEATVREYPIAVRRGAREWAQEFLSEILPGVPFKSGRLAGSAKVRIGIKKTAGKENVSASIVFKTPYARKVHEQNKKHPEDEKFLERPLLAKVPTAGAEIAEKVSLKRAAMK